MLSGASDETKTIATTGSIGSRWAVGDRGEWGVGMVHCKRGEMVHVCRVCGDRGHDSYVCGGICIVR